MKSAIEPPSFRVRWGPTARDVLTDSTRGQVLAVMSQAVYLECKSGELVWLTTDAAPMHWRAVVLQDALPQPPTRAAFAADGSGITFEGGPSLRWAPTELWQSQAITRSTRAGIQTLTPRLSTLHSVLDALPPPKGFGVLTGSVLEGSMALAGPSPVVADRGMQPDFLPDGPPWHERFGRNGEPFFGVERRRWEFTDARDFSPRDREVYRAFYERCCVTRTPRSEGWSTTSGARIRTSSTP